MNKHGIRVGTKAIVTVGLAVIALIAIQPASAHNAPGIKARLVPGSVVADFNLALAWGRIRVANRRAPTFLRRWDVVACRVVVHTFDHRDITTGRVTNPWDTVGRVWRGRVRVLRFQVAWEWDQPAHHLHFGHCHVPAILN